ncbi:MAG TPA: JAB domain-containing protein, partial [Saprospiraceae bacterium]|nr:JAB domain-containing protein [Saprospiraceae bacterium]
DIISHVADVKANVFVCAHNHPSGSTTPSQQDITLTQKLATAARYIDSTLVDHIIIAGNEYYSFQNSGYL